jgi:hypothetical protein
LQFNDDIAWQIETISEIFLLCEVRTNEPSSWDLFLRTQTLGGALMAKFSRALSTNIRFISILLIVLFSMSACATAPIMQSIPLRPSVVEDDVSEFPQKFQLVLESFPGETIKCEMYTKLTLQIGNQDADIYAWGNGTLITEDVSAVDRLTFKAITDVNGGIIGKPITAVKSNCRMVFSRKGKLISTDCPNVNASSFPEFPEESISPGAEWRRSLQFDDPNFGKVNLSGVYKFTTYSLVDNRVLAKIQFSGEQSPSLRSRDVTITNLQITGLYYYDVTLKQLAYSEGHLHMSGFQNGNKQSFSSNTEIVLKLDYSNSLFKSR